MNDARLILSSLIALAFVAAGCDGETTPPDGGDLDGGNEEALVLGDDCDPANDECPEGLACETSFEEPACTRACEEHGDCGSTQGQQNLCVPVSATDNRCLRGCSRVDEGTCPRTDWLCWPLAEGNACLPDCRVVDDFCPGGTVCDATSGICRPVGPRGHYETCDPRSASTLCTAENICIVTDPAAEEGICLLDCDDNPAVCPDADECVLELVGGGRACVRPCIPQGDGCPDGSSCKPLGAASYCLP